MTTCPLKLCGGNNTDKLATLLVTLPQAFEITTWKLTAEAVVMLDTTRELFVALAMGMLLDSH